MGTYDIRVDTMMSSVIFICSAILINKTDVEDNNTLSRIFPYPMIGYIVFSIIGADSEPGFWFHYYHRVGTIIAIVRVCNEKIMYLASVQTSYPGSPCIWWSWSCLVPAYTGTYEGLLYKPLISSWSRPRSHLKIHCLSSNRYAHYYLLNPWENWLCFQMCT